jgi:KDO2-lipid IV(A) lauroyltransferase
MTAPWRNLRWFLAYWISRTGAVLGRFIPARVWYALADPVADLCFFFMRRQRRVVEANLRRVVGEQEAKRAARRVFHNFARYIIDFYQLPSLSKEALCNRIEFHDWRHLNEALQPGRGGVFVTMHLGQAELGAGALAAYGHPVSAIAQSLPYKPMDDFIQGLRRNLGMKVIPAHKARFGVVRCLKSGDALGMMVDVVEPGEGVVVDFFGAPVEFSSAPARIALLTGTRVLPGVVARSEHDPMKLRPIIDFGLEFTPSGDEEADVQALTQVIAGSLEQFVRRFPDQWFAFRPAFAEAKSAPKAGDWRLWALKAGTWLGNVLPRHAAYALGRLGADLAYRQRHEAREAVRDNMRHVMGPAADEDAIDHAAREAFRNVARYYVDLIRIPRMNLEAMIGKEIRIHGLERLQEPMAQGRGAVAATVHFGNMEMAVQVGAILGIDMLVLAEPLQPPAFADLMRRLRSTFGPRYEDVSFRSIAESIRHLRRRCQGRRAGQRQAPARYRGDVDRGRSGAVDATGAHLAPHCHGQHTRHSRSRTPAPGPRRLIEKGSAAGLLVCKVDVVLAHHFDEPRDVRLRGGGNGTFPSRLAKLPGKEFELSGRGQLERLQWTSIRGREAVSNAARQQHESAGAGLPAVITA